jgi:hypothetical protein
MPQLVPGGLLEASHWASGEVTAACDAIRSGFSSQLHRTAGKTAFCALFKSLEVDLLSACVPVRHAAVFTPCLSVLQLCRVCCVYQGERGQCCWPGRVECT